MDKTLSQPVLDVIRDFKFDLMTPVQVSEMETLQIVKFAKYRNFRLPQSPS